jgi:hypothetical protein
MSVVDDRSARLIASSATAGALPFSDANLSDPMRRRCYRNLLDLAPEDVESP